MTKRKIISILLIAVVICGSCLLMAGCPGQDVDKDKNKKYDVSMKIVCKEVVDGATTGPILGEWIFTPDIDEMHIERKYDGKQYKYYIYKYNLPEHPKWNDDWFSLNGEGANVFQSNLWKEGQTSGNRPKNVCEKGLYCLSVEACGTSNIWNQRFVDLYITVK